MAVRLVVNSAGHWVGRSAVHSAVPKADLTAVLRVGPRVD